MNKTLIERFNLTSLIALITLGVVLPLLFIPNTVNPFETSKILFLIIITSLLVISWSVISLIRGKVMVSMTPLSLPVILVATAYLASLLWSGANRIESLMGKGLLIPLLSILFLIVSSGITNRKLSKYVFYSLIGASVFLSFLTIFQALGGFPASIINQILGTTFPATLAFTPAGSPLALVGLLLPVTIATLTYAFTQKETLEKVVFILLSCVMAGTLVLTTGFLLKKENTPRLVSYQHDWAIALETFKESGRTALFGFGPESYSVAYAKNRPVETNLTESWNNRFSTGSNEPLTTASTTGLLGVITWIFLFLSVIKTLRIKTQNPSDILPALKAASLSLFVLVLFIPSTLMSLSFSFLFLSLWALELKLGKDDSVKNLILARVYNGEEHLGKLTLNKVREYRYGIGGVILITIPLILITLYVDYLSVKAYAAEMTFRDSLEAARDNAGRSYELQRQAILTNPYISAYRRTYAVTNLSLANALGGKKDLTDQDRQTITQLIQQAIREGKAATALDPRNATNWETLAGIYRNLINVAQNADDWTTAAYAQAIQNDPLNPRLRLELGGIFYNLKSYDQAIRLFQQAVELKPDWANAYYNLAAAYREKGETANAFAALGRAVGLLDPDSPDYAKAQEEANALRDKLVKTKEEQSGESQEPGEPTILATPTPLPTPRPQGEIELPGDAGTASPSGDILNQPVNQE